MERGMAAVLGSIPAERVLRHRLGEGDGRRGKYNDNENPEEARFSM